MSKFKVGEMTVEPGATLLMEGSNSPQLYTALYGMGLRFKTLENGRRQVITFVMPGDFMGLQAGVMKEMKHSAEAVTAMTLCVFDRSALWTLFRSSPELAFNLTWLAALEEHFLGEGLSALGQCSAEEKIAWALLRFYHRCEAVGLAQNDVSPFPFRQQDLADALGLSLVHTNKTLKDLSRRQILALDGKQLRILNANALKRLAVVDLEPVSVRPLI